MADLRVIGIIVSTTLGIGGVSWAVAAWGTTRVSTTDSAAALAKIEGQAINDKVELQLEDQRIDRKVNSAIEEMKQVGRDVKTVKCILLAPNSKQKSRCALEQ